MTTSPELPILPFKTAKEWENWLEKNHQIQPGVWLQFFKKNSDTPTITYSEAVDVALCFGWIDSQMKKFDEFSYIQRFTPRRSKSIWSKINVKKIEGLLAAGRMRPAGLQQVQDAKQDGRWDQAYNPPSTTTVPDDLLKELEKYPKAKTFFATLNKTNRYAIAWRLETAKKPETRAKRLSALIEMLDKGEKIH